LFFRRCAAGHEPNLGNASSHKENTVPADQRLSGSTILVWLGNSNQAFYVIARIFISEFSS
jgi:hypothetical protein